MFLSFFVWNAALTMGGIAQVSQVQLLQSFVMLAVAAPLLGEAVPLPTIGFAAAVAAVVWMGRVPASAERLRESNDPHGQRGRSLVLTSAELQSPLSGAVAE